MARSLHFFIYEPDHKGVYRIHTGHGIPISETAPLLLQNEEDAMTVKLMKAVSATMVCIEGYEGWYVYNYLGVQAQC